MITQPFNRLHKGLIGAVVALAALALGIIATTRANAANLDNKVPGFTQVPTAIWTGAYVGLHGGYSIAGTEVGLGGLSVDGLASQGPCGGIHAGYNVQLPSSIVVVGARGGYTWCNNEFSVGPGLFKASMDNGWHADGLLGIAMGPVMPYVGGGYTKVQTSASLLGVAVPGTPDMEGWRAFTGIELRPANFGNASIGLEYVYTDFKDQTFFGGALTTDTQDHKFMGRLNFRLGVPSAAAGLK